MRRFTQLPGGAAAVVAASQLFAARRSQTNGGVGGDLSQEIADIKKFMARKEANRSAESLISLYANRRVQKLSIRKSLRIFNNPSYNAFIFCHEWLPVILARFIAELDSLPNGLNAMPSMHKVRDTLEESFLAIARSDIPVTKAEEENFTTLLEGIEERHGDLDLLQTMAMGVLELKEHLSRHRRALVNLKNSGVRWRGIALSEKDILPYDGMADIQEPLDACNLNLINYNFLSRMLLNMSPDTAAEKRVGMVDLEINLENVVRGAVMEAKQICTDYYGDAPDVKYVTTHSSKMRFPFMSTTLQYIVVELMKNAFRATVEAHMEKNEMVIVSCDNMPPVTVLINVREDLQHACIRVSDEGQGMTQEALGMAMAYSYTSVDKPALSLDEKKKSAIHLESPLAGYGYGLPMSRMYARAFDGDLVLQTMEGYGTSAYYYIKL